MVYESENGQYSFYIYSAQEGNLAPGQNGAKLEYICDSETNSITLQNPNGNFEGHFTLSDDKDESIKILHKLSSAKILRFRINSHGDIVELIDIANKKFQYLIRQIHDDILKSSEFINEIQQYEIDLKNRRDDALRKNTQKILYIVVSIAAIYIFDKIIKAF